MMEAAMNAHMRHGLAPSDLAEMASVDGIDSVWTEQEALSRG
jgi:hypothetical protein